MASYRPSLPMKGLIALGLIAEDQRTAPGIGMSWVSSDLNVSQDVQAIRFIIEAIEHREPAAGNFEGMPVVRPVV